MKLVDRLIWHELFGPLLNSIFMFLMLLFASNLLFRLTDLLTKGVPFAAVMQLALYSLPPLITQTLPMGMLLGTLLAFGRLSGDSEHVALYASGISFNRVTMPVAAMGLVVSVLAIAWNETVVPPTTREFYKLFQRATENVATSTHQIRYDIMKRGTEQIDETVLVAGGYDARDQSLHRVTILKMSDDPRYQGQPDVLLYADRVQARDPRGNDWTCYDGFVHYVRPDKYRVDTSFEVGRTQPYGVTVGRTFRGVMQEEVTDNHRLTFQQLRDKIIVERSQGNEDAARKSLGDEVDLWEKVSLPFASLIFGLVAAPLGLRPNRGSRAMGFGIAVGIIFIYWVIYHWMWVVGKEGGLPPMLASFTADILGLIGATVLIYRTKQ